MSKLVDFTLTPEQDLIALVNLDHGTNFTLDDVTLSTPVSVDYQGRNTKVTVTSKNRRKYVGSRDMYYNRIDLQEFTPIEVLMEDMITPALLIGQLNAENHVVFDVSDLIDYSFLATLQFAVVTTVTLTAKVTSLRWKGTASADIVYGLPANITALNHLVRDILPTPGYLP